MVSPEEKGERALIHPPKAEEGCRPSRPRAPTRSRPSDLGHLGTQLGLGLIAHWQLPVSRGSIVAPPSLPRVPILAT